LADGRGLIAWEISTFIMGALKSVYVSNYCRYMPIRCYDVGVYGESIPEMHCLWANLAVPELLERALPSDRRGLSRCMTPLKPEWLLELLSEGCAESGYLMGAEKADGDSWRHDGRLEGRLEIKRARPDIYVESEELSRGGYSLFADS
jgi:hypothetical protein